MRICAVSLPELRIELVRSRAPDLARRPLAVVVAPAPMTEAKLLGNTRLSVVSAEARALGVMSGQTIAQARARVADLAVRVVRPEAVRDVLCRLAEVGLAFGATVAFGMEGDSPCSDHPPQGSTPPRRGTRARRDPKMGDFGDVLWIDVTGCAHLHAPAHGSHQDIESGEGVLAARLVNVMISLGHACSVAIADGPRVSAMLARAAFTSLPRKRTKDASLLEPIVVRTGENAEAIAALSVAALPLVPEDVRWLAKVGIRTIAQLRSLPKDELGTRLGASAHDVLSLATGEDRAPLRSYIPPEVPEDEVELEYGVEGSEALTFVAKTLTDRMATRLQVRAMAASCIELELHLDRAMLASYEVANDDEPTEAPGTSGAHSPAIEIVRMDLPAPLSTANDLLLALRPKIERLSLAAPVLLARLRVPVLVHKRAAALSLFDPEPKAERALPRLVAELASDLGSEAVSKLVLGDSWSPDERSRLVPFSMTADDKTNKPRRRVLSSVPEPTRLLAKPRSIAPSEARITRHLSRLDSIEWWKTAPSAPTHGSTRRGVDYVQAWTNDGLAWIELDRATGGMRVRGWFD